MNSWRALPLLTASLIFFPGLVKADRFAVAVVGDTQFTIEEAPEVFLAQMEWIVRNRDDRNIVYVATLGDMKDDGLCDVKDVRNPETGNTTVPLEGGNEGDVRPLTEWDILNFGYRKLDNAVPRIPYGVVPGNHDYDQGRTFCFTGEAGADDRTTRLSQYNRFFGPDRFNQGSLPTANGGVPEDWYGGNLSENGLSNEDNYTLFSSHGIDFIAINLGYREFAYQFTRDDNNVNLCSGAGVPKTLHDANSHAADLCDFDVAAGADPHDTEIHWIDRLLTNNPNRLAIITSHYLVRSNPPRFTQDAPGFGAYGQQLLDYLQGHENLFMLLGAHERGEAWIVSNRPNDPPVHGLLSNYQDQDFPTGDPTLAATFQNITEHLDHADSFTTPVARHGIGFSGFIRLMTFDTETGLVDIETFSPLIPPALVAGIASADDEIIPPGRALPVGASSPDDRVISVASTNSGDNVPASLPGQAINPTLNRQTATNINNIPFVGYVNLPPTASNVTITDGNGGSADVGDTLTADYDYNDLDANDIESNSSFRWLRNGLAIPGATALTYVLAAADASRAVSFEVTPNSNNGPPGLAVASDSLTVSDVVTQPAPLSWTISGPSAPVAAQNTPTQWTLSYDYNGNGPDPRNFSTLTWTATSSPVGSPGDYTFNWTYSGFHAFFRVRARLTTSDGAILVDAGPANCCTTPSNGFNYSGSYTFTNLQAGDRIRFAMSGSNFDSNNRLLGSLNLVQLPR